ncbi:MAG: phosphatase PAP2 family protein [Thermomicrobiales bacterium]
MSLRIRGIYAVAAVSTAGVIAHSVRRGKTAGFDARITTAIQRRSNPAFVATMRTASWAGFPPQSRILPLAIPSAIALLADRVDALFQLLAWGTSGISGAIKFLMRRPRPHPDRFTVAPARIGGTSFPSGHVINYTGVYGFLAFLASQRIEAPWLRRSVVGCLSALIALVGPSRIYLGHHWFTDVVTSYLLGSTYVLALITLYQRLQRRGIV